MSVEPRPALRNPTSHERVLDELRQRLIDGRLKPGQRVVQESLAAEFSSSVVPIREALKTLESEGQMTYLPHRGFFVTELRPDDLLELCEIRSRLEGLAVERALERIAPSALDESRTLLGEMRSADKAGDVTALVMLDRRFHFTFYRASSMSHLLRMISVAWDLSNAYRARYFSSAVNREADHVDHREILEAAVGRDPAAMNALLDAHRLRPVNMLLEAETHEGGLGDRRTEAS
jgi:DNA-binding GntR family transcriptional regulator